MTRLETDSTINVDSPCLVFVTGTHQLPFNRMVEMAYQYAIKNPSVTVVLQYGTSSTPNTPVPENLKLVSCLTRRQTRKLQEKADFLITQGGPSMLMEWVRAGHCPLILPRRPELGEVVDGHQFPFARFAQKHGLGRVIETLADIPVPPFKLDSKYLHEDLPLSHKIGTPASTSLNFNRVVDSVIAARHGNLRIAQRETK